VEQRSRIRRHQTTKKGLFPRPFLPQGFVHKGVGVVADPSLAEAPDPPPGWRYSKPGKRGYLIRGEAA